MEETRVLGVVFPWGCLFIFVLLFLEAKFSTLKIIRKL
jgi:hypothetical protein